MYWVARRLGANVHVLEGLDGALDVSALWEEAHSPSCVSGVSQLHTPYSHMVTLCPGWSCPQDQVKEQGRGQPSRGPRHTGVKDDMTDYGGS